MTGSASFFRGNQSSRHLRNTRCHRRLFKCHKSKGRNSLRDQKDVCTQTRAHTYTHAYTRTHARTCVYTHVCTHMHAHTYTQTRTRTRTHLHACTRACTHTYARTYTHAHTCMHIHARTHMHARPCVHTLTRTHTHVHAHTHSGERAHVDDKDPRLAGRGGGWEALRACWAVGAEMAPAAPSGAGVTARPPRNGILHAARVANQIRTPTMFN